MAHISELTGVEIGAVRKRDVTQAPQGSAAGILGIPEFERLQVRSVLHGDIVRIRLGRALVLMPFALEFDGIYRSAVSPALAENGLDGIRADELNATGAVLPQVWELIRTSEVIVVDVSNQNPNVIYEIGLCFGLGRCPILLARKPGDLPFNLRLLRYTPYENTPAGLADLRLRLTDTIRQFLATTRARIERARE